MYDNVLFGGASEIETGTIGIETSITVAYAFTSIQLNIGTVNTCCAHYQSDNVVFEVDEPETTTTFR